MVYHIERIENVECSLGEGINFRRMVTYKTYGDVSFGRLYLEIDVYNRYFSIKKLTNLYTFLVKL